MKSGYRSFDNVATDYDTTRFIPPPQLESIARICARVSGVNQGGLFLDAGVGTGRFAVPLAKLAPDRVIGIDISRSMMARIIPKDPKRRIRLISGDLRRLPLADRSIRGALAVHIFHLIEDWPAVLDELWRVIEPGGVLLLGAEQGGRSILTDFYYERARARRVLSENIGATGAAPTLNYLRKASSNGRPVAAIEQLSTPFLVWKRTLPVRHTLSYLERATFSQMWEVPEDIHRMLLQETEEYARRTFGDLNRSEVLKAHFVLHAVRWPSQS